MTPKDDENKINFWKTKEFEDLEQKWYSELKLKGFNDAETKNDLLSNWSSEVHKKRYGTSPEKYKAKETYYRWAGFLLHDHSFDNEREKIIWELHSQGISIRNIEKKLKNTAYKRCSLEIWKVIKRLAKIMKEKYGTREEE